MAQASRKVRQTRRLKRERTIAFRMVDQLVKERNMARAIIQHLTEQLKPRSEDAPVEVIEAVAATDWTTQPGPNTMEENVEG